MALFENKNVLVTGGGRGIGKEVALDFASRGANVAVSARTEKELIQTVTEIENYGVEGFAIPSDLSTIEGIHRCAKTFLDHFGRCDVLVCNAGMTQVASIVEMDIERAKKLFDLNIMGYYGLIKFIVPNMIDNKAGSIIMTSSVQGNVFYPPKKAAYSASKAAVTAMGKCLNTEFKPHGISVNVILPGGIETSMADRLRKWGQQMPVTDPPEAISPIYLFLATEEAKKNRYGGEIIDQMKIFEFLPQIKEHVGEGDFNIKTVAKEMKGAMKKTNAKMFRKNKELIDFLLRFKR